MKRRSRLLLAGTAAAIMLLDNITTVLALGNGALEANPLVAPFTSNLYMFTLFTIVKIAIASYITYRYVNTWRDLLVWLIVMLIFIRAIIINVVNAL